ncbi:MAG: DeoR/GlpR family DNA-binding transcription regulator [Anaerolineales bacterium]|nr:DeoR/GlpR family DNA-binding transcription regulator [Anaerolineales bacterium]
MSKQLIPAQRRERIQAYLAQHKIAPSAELSALLGVSEATVRRDLEWMENEGILYRTHGGAILSQHLQLEPEYKQRAQRQVQEKRAIGKLAASMVAEGEIIFVNSGSTTTQLIQQIRTNSNISVVTNNLSAALEVGETSLELILVGGLFQPKSNSVAGRFAIDNLNQIYADKAFIGVDGITVRHGYTVPSNDEAEVIRLMLERTNGPVYIVADHTKWGTVSNFEVAQINEIPLLITDEKFVQIAREALTKLHIQVFDPNHTFPVIQNQILSDQ